MTHEHHGPKSPHICPGPDPCFGLDDVPCYGHHLGPGLCFCGDPGVGLQYCLQRCRQFSLDPSLEPCPDLYSDPCPDPYSDPYSDLCCMPRVRW